MKLSQLLDSLPVSKNLPDVDITTVTCDSRQVKKGCAFVAVTGQRQDGHTHIAQALQKGAAVILCQRDCGIPNQIILPDTRSAYAKMCANFYGNPARKLKLIGVTGTNGKTTTAWMLHQMLVQMGEKAGLIGTICNKIGETSLPAQYTTPEPRQLHGLLHQMMEEGCEYVVMETSSHALAQSRLEGCTFACGIFLNLSPEHLDFHKNMENYYQAKRSLFYHTHTAIVNLDDTYGRRLIKELSEVEGLKLSTFSTKDDSANYTARQIETLPDGSRFAMVGTDQIARVKIPMPGEFSVSNGLAAATALLALDFPFQKVIVSLNECSGVPGRIELLPTNGDFTVIRDYAHTPDGLEKVLTTIRQFAPGRVITLFGCPGRRDAGKRSKMAAVVSAMSDCVILTSDNPRDEDANNIIEDALTGIKKGTPCHVIPDRLEAIHWALSQCKKGDTLLLAGKGHEDYQVLRDCTISFDEREIVLEQLGQKQ